jgi:hypothetical protein
MAAGTVGLGKLAVQLIGHSKEEVCDKIQIRTEITV